MVQLPPPVVGDARTSSFHWAILQDLVDIDSRMAGQEGERRAAERVRRGLDEAGARNVHLDTFEIDGWWRGESSMEVANGTDRLYDADHDVLGLPGTPTATVEGPVVDVGMGTRADVEVADLGDSVALVSSESPSDRSIHRMEKFVNVLEGGASGFVFRNHVPGCLPPTGEIGYGTRPAPIPGVGVSAELGERLRRRAADGDSVTLSVSAEHAAATSQNVVADLGPDTGDHVRLTCHYDAHDISEGANDNGAGTAILCEIARLLSGLDAQLDRRVRFTAFGAEEVGMKGAYHAASTSALGDLRCLINLDGAGQSRNPRLRTAGFEGLVSLYESVTDEYDIPLRTEDELSAHADQWAFTERGVPTGLVVAHREQAGRGWGHTHADTLDKLDVRDLRDFSVLNAAVVLAAAQDDRAFEPQSPAAIRERVDEDLERELRAGGRWHFDDIEGSR